IRSIREQVIAMEARAPRGDRSATADDERKKGARLVAQVVVLAQVVLADGPQKHRRRELILELEARDQSAPDTAPVGPPPEVLKRVRSIDADTDRRSRAHAHRDVVNVRLRPLEEILVPTPEVHE